MAPEDGKAMIMLRLAQGNSTAEAANSFITENKLTALQSKNIQVNGFPATVVLSEQRPDPQQQQQQNPQPACPDHPHHYLHDSVQ